VDSIALRPDLRESLERDAAIESRSVEDLVNEAVARYLRDRQREKIRRETAAFERLHPRLRRDHPDQWVAIDGGQLVDVDADLSALYARVRAKYGRASVLIRQVREHPVDDIRVRTPSTGRLSA
jgi:hypothetical protein